MALEGRTRSDERMLLSTPRPHKRKIASIVGSLPDRLANLKRPKVTMKSLFRRMDGLPTDGIETTPRRPVRFRGRRLFVEPRRKPQIIFLSHRLSGTLKSKTTKCRLPNNTWVGIRAPWSATECPLCPANLKSMLSAVHHLRGRHNARQSLLLCAICGVSRPTVAEITGHAARCSRFKPSKLAKAGKQKCTHCSRSFESKRGLSQHYRLSHPMASMDMAFNGMKLSLQGFDGVQLSADLCSKLDGDEPYVCPRDQTTNELMVATGRSLPLSESEIEEATRTFIKVVQSNFRIRLPTPNWNRKVPSLGGNKRRKTMRYKLIQKLWRTKRRAVLPMILEGEIPSCSVPVERVYSYYQSVWSPVVVNVSLDGFGHLPRAKNSIFDKPISKMEVSSYLKNAKSNSSPGIDGVKYNHLKAIDRNGDLLAKLFNDWLISGFIPNCLKQSKTTLIPKTNDPTEAQLIKNWRPITLGSTILRTFSGVMALRVNDACPQHPRQRGFMKAPGCSENLTVLDGLIKLCKRERRSLACVFVDLAKAFDTVPHSLIRSSLALRGVDIGVIKCIESMYSGCSSRIGVGHGLTKPISLKVGVKQGDPLSPSLFNLSLDPLLFALEAHGEGFDFGNDAEVTALAYADDLVLLSNSWSGMARNIGILEKFSVKAGLAVNPNKCHGFFLSRHDTKPALNNCPPWLISGEPLHMIGGAESVKYLGIEINPWRGIMPSPIYRDLEALIPKIGAAPLKPSQKVELLRSYVLPRFLYVADMSEIPVSSLITCDRLIRRSVKQWLHLAHFVTDGLLYSKYRDGGLGLQKLSTQAPATRLRRLVGMINSEDPVTNAVCSLLSLSQKAKKLYEHLTGLAAPVNLDNLNLTMVQSHKLKDREFAKWEKLKQQGQGITAFKGDRVSNKWLRIPARYNFTEGEFALALQLRTGTLPTRNVMKGRTHDNTSTSCRLCGYATESPSHIIGSCPILRPNRMKNHNTVVQSLRNLAEKKGWSVWVEKHIHSDDGQLGVPDLILRKGPKALVVDVAVAFESSVDCLTDLARKKTEKYLPFVSAVQKWLKVTSIEVHGFPIGARGKWHRGNDDLLLTLGVTETSISVAAGRFSRLALFGSINTCKAFKRLITQQ